MPKRVISCSDPVNNGLDNGAINGPLLGPGMGSIMGWFGDPKYSVCTQFNDPAYFRAISRLITTIFLNYTGKLSEHVEVVRRSDGKWPKWLKRVFRVCTIDTTSSTQYLTRRGVVDDTFRRCSRDITCVEVITSCPIHLLFWSLWVL